MTILATLFICALGLAVFFPDTPEGKLLRSFLVDFPATKLANVSPAVATLWLLVFFGIALFIEIMGTEGAQMVAMTLPEMLAWYVVYDISAYIDILLVAWLLSTFARSRETLRALARQTLRPFRAPAVAARPLMRRLRRGSRARTTRPQRPTRRSEDEPNGIFYGAAAA